MRTLELSQRLIEFAQRAAHEAAWQARHSADMAQRAAAEASANERNAALVDAQNRLAAQQKRIADLIEQQMQEPPAPSPAPEPPAPSPAPEPPAPAPSPTPYALRFDAMVRLVASMTPEERSDPASAAEAALAQLNAINARA
jgi:hypothetical protein